MNSKRKRCKVSCSSSLSSNLQTITETDKEDCGDQRKIIQLRCHTLETLPPELLEMILRFLPLKDVAGSVRLTSRRLSMVASTVLNGTFVMAGTRLQAAIKHVESLMSKAVTEIERVAWSKSLNILELTKYQYKMLKAVTWRYTHPRKCMTFSRVCFYAGSLLDELNDIIRIAKMQLPVLVTDNDRKSADSRSLRLAAFVDLCKRFMNYFEKVTEYKLNRSPLISGCKAVDLLDCLAEGREVMEFRVVTARDKGQGQKDCNKNNQSGSIITMRLRYVMRRTWFTCLHVPSAPDENSWREDQRFMYRRLRRLVGSVNEHHLEKVHYEREVLMRTTLTAAWQSRTLRPPSASTYSGYGIYAGRFFYYGHMNTSAYDSKFKDIANVLSDGPGREAETDDDEDDEEHQHIRPRGPPIFDLVIDVELCCSSELAPLAVISSLQTNEFDDIIDSEKELNANNQLQYSLNNTQDHPQLYMKLNIACPASSANRLPSNFIWEQQGPTHPRQKRARFSY